MVMPTKPSDSKSGSSCLRGHGVLRTNTKRKMTIKAADLAHYVGERGRRGNKLPRGLQRIDELLVGEVE